MEEDETEEEEENSFDVKNPIKMQVSIFLRLLNMCTFLKIRREPETQIAKDNHWSDPSLKRNTIV